MGKKEVVHEVVVIESDSDFERIDGVIRSLNVGKKEDGGVFFAVTGEPMKTNGLTIREIILDRAKLAKFGISHFVITVADGNGSRIWREILNPANVSIEHDISDLMRVSKPKRGFEVL